MFINIYLSAYSVDKAITLNTPGPWWGCAAVAVAAMLLEDTPVMLNVVEVVPCPCSTLGTVPCLPQQQGQSVGSSSQEKVGYKGC